MKNDEENFIGQNETLREFDISVCQGIFFNSMVRAIYLNYQKL